MGFKKILKIKGLKYWVATAVFLLVIFFFDQNTLIDAFRLNREVAVIDDSIALLEKKNAEDSAYNASLKNNPDALEILGRTEYYMKRENEDIFVFKQTGE